MCVSGPCQYHAALSPLTQVNQVVDYYKFFKECQRMGTLETVLEEAE
jgi:hypothetical protein